MSIKNKNRFLLFCFILMCVIAATSGIAYGESLTLTWQDNSNNEEGFNIERKVGQTGTFAPLGQTAANVATYVDTSVPNGQLYCYRVNAFKTGEVSPWSADGCGRDTDIIIAPGGVTVTITTTTTIITTAP